MLRGQSFRLLAVLVIVLFSTNCGKKDSKPEPGGVLDEAMRAERKAESFPAADEDYFKDMDGGGVLS